MNRLTAPDDESALLSPLEHVFTGAAAYENMALYSYPSALDRTQLQNSLQQAVARFPWTWCRLQETPDRGSLRMVPSDEPVLLEDGNLGSSRGEMTRFVNSLDTANGGRLTRFCLTETPSGSVLGARMSHALVDGTSFYHFLMSWAQLARGEPIVDPVRAPISYNNNTCDDPGVEQILSDCGLFTGGVRKAVSSDSINIESLDIGAADIASLRERAQRDTETRLTTHDVLTAYVWQKYGPDWCRDAGESEAFLSCPVDMRALTNMPLNHFGCAIGFAVTRMDVDRLRHAPLGELALKVRQAVKSLTVDSFPTANATLHRVRREHGLKAAQQLHLVHPRAGMIISNLTRAPVAMLNFGGGTPTVLAADSGVCQAATFYSYADAIQVRLYKDPNRLGKSQI